MSDNPYAPPQESADGQDDVPDLRGKRLLASIVDSIILALIVVPIMFAVGYFDQIDSGSSVAAEIGVAVLGWAAFLVVNGYLLINRGQTVGKVLTKVQIVDVETDKLLPLFRVYVLRNLWILPPTLLVIFIPGQQDDSLVNVIMLVDALMIFGAAQRCLHDRIAGSKVVPYEPGRSTLE